MVKVILISTQAIRLPPPGYSGLERLVYQLAVGLNKIGDEVTVVAPGDSVLPEGITLIPGPSTRSRAYNTGNPEREAYLTYKPIIERMVDKDTVICSHTWTGWEFLMYRKHPKWKFTHTFHGPDGWQLADFMVDGIRHNNIRLYGVSRAHATRLSEQMGTDVSFIYNGVDPDEYPLNNHRDDYLLFLGLIAVTKGADRFAKYLAGTKYNAVIAGEDMFIADPAYVVAMRSLCSHYPNLQYYGSVFPELKYHLMSRARMMIYPYHPEYFEAFGLAVVEAMLTGTPVYATNSGAMSEILPEWVQPAVNHDSLWRELDNVVNSLSSYSPGEFRKHASRFSISTMVTNYHNEMEAILRQ